MGVGGNFWDLLKPYARYEGFDFLRNKKIAVDLSFWIVQQQTALQSSNVRNPHLRLTFFRTINLFAKFGAYPVFVVDGKPSPFKSKARIARFYRSSGIEPKDMPVAEEGVSVDRNKHFVACVEKCVLLGMPVLRASDEAEALSAQLNNKWFVDACITAHSDTFLFGAKCVIKHVDPKTMTECCDAQTGPTTPPCWCRHDMTPVRTRNPGRTLWHESGLFRLAFYFLRLFIGDSEASLCLFLYFKRTGKKENRRRMKNGTLEA